MPADNARVHDLLDAAARLHPAERAQFLRDGCRGDDALRREVESLLAALDRSPDLLTVSPVHFAHAAAAAAGERPGDTIGPYALAEQIGEGGFGTVYRAEQTRPVRRTVALKVIKPGMDSRQVIARFEAERQALAMMDHPHIARVFDAGTTDSGRPYFAMELVHGPPVTAYCDERGAGLRERLRLFEQVCRAVQHAHQKGVIHRDLKPGNVLVALCDGRPVPKVIDFGVAKATAQRLTERTLLTEFHHPIGTPAYMSPEQADGTAADVDTRSDVYSLGVLLYELLTGTTPFETGELRGKSMGEIQRVIREVEPPRPSARLSALAAADESKHAERRLGRAVRGDLDWIVMRCLEKDPARRYPSAGDLAADVRRHLAGEPVSAGPPSGLYRLRKFARRNKVLIATVTAVAAALVVGSSLAFYGMVRATRARANEARERQVAGAVSRVLQDMLASVDPDLGEGRDVLVRQVLDEAARKLDGGSLRDQPEVEAAVRATLGRSYVALGRFAQAEPQLRKALEVRRRVLGPEHPDVAESLYDLGTALQLKRDDAGALAAYRESVAMSRRLLPPGHPVLARRLINYGIVLGWADDYASAEAVLREAMALNRRLGADADVAKCVHCLGGLSFRKGDLATAAARYREAIALYRKALGPENRQVAIALGQLGTTLNNMGDPAGAEPLLREQVAMGEKLLGAAHPHVTGARRGLADALERQGRWDEAVEVRDAAIAAEVAQLTQALANDPADLVSLTRRAEGYAEWGRIDEAIADFDRAIALQPNRASLRAARGDAHARAGRFREALADYTAALGLDPDEHLRWAYAAALTAYLGDQTGYRALCARIMRRFGQDPKRPDIAERMAKASMLLPGAIDPADAVRLADHALAGAADVPPDFLPWFRVTKGMAEYRAGHYAAAVRSLTEGRDGYVPAQVGRNFAMATASADLFLAMAHHRLGDAAAARAALARAAARIDAAPPPAPGAAYRADYQHWLVCQTVRREAEAMIAGTSAGRTDDAARAGTPR